MSLSIEEERKTWKEWYYLEYLNSPEWKQKSEKKKRLAGYRCEICGRHKSEVVLVVHHKSYYDVPFEKMKDLECLCLDGHDYRHSRRIEPCTSFKPKVILRKKKK